MEACGYAPSPASRCCGHGFSPGGEWSCQRSRRIEAEGDENKPPEISVFGSEGHEEEEQDDDQPQRRSDAGHTPSPQVAANASDAPDVLDDVSTR